MYIRFITQFINEDNEPETGIFHALRFVAEHSLTQDEDANQLKTLNKWFSVNLAKPDRFSNASRPHAEAIALSWYKDSAKEHIRLTYDIIALLEKYHLVVERVATKNPGYIIYEDEYQVSAVPFRTDRKK
ncbi:MAG: hypothetical protein ACXVIY_00780, partial [Mucilaginibacter sp.]